jgi:hypothetical protein
LKLRKRIEDFDIETSERSESIEESLVKPDLINEDEDSFDCKPNRVHSSDQLKTTLALMQQSYAEKFEEEE